MIEIRDFKSSMGVMLQFFYDMCLKHSFHFQTIIYMLFFLIILEMCVSLLLFISLEHALVVIFSYMLYPCHCTYIYHAFTLRTITI